VTLYRAFEWDGASLGRGDGGPLFVPRKVQGKGRHDNPTEYGAWYCARDTVSPIAELLQMFRATGVDDDDFTRANGRGIGLVGLELEDDGGVVDLDDPAQLSAKGLRPSGVATPRRAATQAIATAIFREGAVGLSWWSTLNADWTNVTLFWERALPRIRVAGPPRRLTTRDPDVRAAATALGVALRRS
jgi:hypothetical protein